MALAVLHTLRFARSQLMLSTEQGARLWQELTGTTSERAQAVARIREMLRGFVAGDRDEQSVDRAPAQEN